jgi:hypothetical protein
LHDVSIEALPMARQVCSTVFFDSPITICSTIDSTIHSTIGNTIHGTIYCTIYRTIDRIIYQ